MAPDTVAVVGGGAVGLSAAHSLADRSVEVVLFERDDPGAGSSGRAAGICYDAFADRLDAEIARESLAWFREQGLLVETPYVWAAREADSVAVAIREQVGQMIDRGLDVSLLTDTEIDARFPAIRTGDITIAGLAENAGYLDPGATIDLLVERARGSGVQLRRETPVRLAGKTAIETPDGRESFDSVLVAAGAATGRLLSDIGIDLALGLYRAQAIEAEIDNSDGIPIFYDASTRFYARPTASGVIAGNGAHEYDERLDHGGRFEFDQAGDDEFVVTTAERVEHRFGAGSTVRDSWSGLCTATPDRDPLVGECAPGLYVSTGWHGHGLMRAPAMGDWIAAQICGGDGIASFDPNRFDGDEEITLPDGIVE